MIHVALVSAHPTETDARAGIAAAITEDHTAALGTYLGIWTMPLPYGGRVHVFTDRTFAELEAVGWTREVA